MIEVVSPAKLNTFLSVGAPHQNGYHPIRSIFQAISLHDTITIQISEETKITCNWEGLPESNTLTKVLRLLKELVDLPPAAIHLEKRIPTEAGLGGGSSNAAALLRGVLRFAKIELPWAQAEAIAAAVGADVSFFLVGGRARVTGYGDKVEAMPDSESQHYVLVQPRVGVPTAHAYARLDATEREWREFPDDLLELYNDFESVAPPECLVVRERLLNAGAEGAMLTGSGSVVFGRVANSEEASKVLLKLREEFPDYWMSAAESLTRDQSLRMREVAESCKS